MVEAVLWRLAALALAGAVLLASRPAGAEAIEANRTVRPKDPPAISEADLRAAAAAMDEGRAALRHNDPAGAVQLFTKVLKYPESPYSAEARELLGLARQKGGQLAEARAIYEDYLVRYPNGEESERVRQRLAGIVTATGEPAAPLRVPIAQPTGTLPIGRFTPLHETTWSLVGGVSAFYIHDDSFSTARDPSVAPDPTADRDTHAVHQNEILSTVDLMATWNNDATRGRIRFSGGEEHRFSSNQGAYQVDETGVSALSIDAVIKDWNLRTVAGRQTFNVDGVFGRFDGAFFSWQPLPMLRVDLVGGSPASSRYDLPFKNERYFYGAAFGVGPLFGGLETSIYAIEQRDRWLVDREAIGSDFRYVDLNKFAFGTIDYDVHFNRLNAAIISGSWTLPDTTTIYGGADYRRAPYLSTWNALINRPFATLYDMLKAQTEPGQQLQQDAYNQTPIYKSAMLGFTRPLTDWLQIGADATIVNLSQPISPIGIDPTLATLAAGNEYYYSMQLIGNSIFRDGDLFIGALRYAQQATDREYVLDLNTRFPLTEQWLLGPRLRLGYSVFDATALKQYTVLPSLFVNYQLTPNMSLEAEIGAQWTTATQAGIHTKDTELFATVGFRYFFDIEGNTALANGRSRLTNPAAAALCRYSAHPGGGSCTPSSSGGL